MELPVITDLVQTKRMELDYIESNNIKAKVLVVDDEVVIRELLTYLLYNKGYEVDTAENGSVAWESLNKTEYDLVLLDMGFVHVEHSGLVQALGIELDGRGNIATDTSYQTSVEGVFSAGDSSTGASLVVRAINHGRRAAASIGQYLANR